MTDPALTTDPNAELPAPFGRRCTVNGHDLQTYRTGQGSAAVVLLPGGGSVGLDMWRVQEGIAQFATVLSHDRGGTGWSSREVKLPRGLREVADELRELLRVADVAGPCILVGHSLGGLYARYFAARHPEQVAGLVLVEPGHEDFRKYMPKELTDVWDSFDPDSAVPAEIPQEARDFYRGLFQEAMADFPDEIREPLVANHVHPGWLRVGIQESSNVKALGEEMRAVADRVPDVPTVILTATGIDAFKRAVSMGVPEELLEAETAGKLRLYDEVAASFSRGENRQVEGVGHVTLVMQRPDAVVQAVRDLMG
jgi:pimeloyl-ACP methyl ester carboxylesterase